MSLDVYLTMKNSMSEDDQESRQVFACNITHNLNAMAEAAGIYLNLWRPEQINITKAKHLIEPLTRGLMILRSSPEKFKQFNPKNGWGTYDGLMEFIEKYLQACCEYPEADVSVWR